MPVDSLRCVNCITMEYNIDEGYKPSEFDDYDFAEDAFDFEVSFKYHLKLSPVVDVEMIILFLRMPQVKNVLSATRKTRCYCFLLFFLLTLNRALVD